jgi:hypothetical protein
MPPTTLSFDLYPRVVAGTVSLLHIFANLTTLLICELYLKLVINGKIYFYPFRSIVCGMIQWLT